MKVWLGVAGALVLVLVGVALMWPWIKGAQTEQAVGQVKIEVAETKTAQAQSVATAEAKTGVESVRTVERTERIVERIVSAPDPDPEFFRGVCESRLYSGDPSCLKFGGGSSDSGS